MVATDPGLQYPPMLNGLDYVDSVVENLAGQPTARNLKFAVLHLQAAVEVLLKVRLTREHWTLVFKDAGKANQASLRSGDFVSIGLDETLKRLEGVAGITLPKSVLDGFTRLSKTRNKLQHFGMEESTLGIEALASEVLNGLLDFMRTHLDSQGTYPDDDAALSKTETLIVDELHRLRGLIAARLKAIEPDLERRVAVDEKIVGCPGCFQSALAVDDTANMTCLFCHRSWDDGEQLAKDYGSEVLGVSWRDIAKGAEEPVSTCFECGSSALVAGVAVRGRPDPEWLCFDCKTAADMSEVDDCFLCGEPMIMNEETGTVCNDCFTARVNTE